MYLESKKNGIACPGKRLGFHTENCDFRGKRTLKKGLFHRVKELFKVNQIGIPDYQYYLSCNKERMVRLTFLEQKIRIPIGTIDLFAYYLVILFSKK